MVRQRIEAIASYNSRCPQCDGPIEEGDTIVKDEIEDEWVCEECASWAL